MIFVIGNVRCSPFFVSVMVNTFSDQPMFSHLRLRGTRTEDRGQGFLRQLGRFGADEELCKISGTALLGSHSFKVIDWIRHTEDVYGALTLVEGTLDLDIQ